LGCLVFGADVLFLTSENETSNIVGVPTVLT